MFNYTWHRFTVQMNGFKIHDRTLQSKAEIEAFCNKNGWELVEWEVEE